MSVARTLRCPCGAEVIPGCDWTVDDTAAWAAEHAAHQSAQRAPTFVDLVTARLPPRSDVRPWGERGAAVHARSVHEASSVLDMVLLSDWEVIPVGWTIFCQPKQERGLASLLAAWAPRLHRRQGEAVARRAAGGVLEASPPA